VVAVGLALGAGALAGEALAFENVVKSDAHPTGAMKLIGELVGFTPQKGVMSSDLFGPGVLWAVAEVAAMLLFVLWIAACAKLWLRRGGDRAPVAAAMAGLAAASALLTVWTGIFYLLYEVSAPAYRLLGGQLAGEAEKIAQTTWLGSERLYRVVMDPQAMDMYRRWPVLAALVLVWAFPLAAVVRVRGRPRAPRWTFLDRSEPPPVVPVRLQVGRALLVGAGGGLLAIVAVFALRAGLHAWGSEATRGTLEFASAFYYWEVVLVLIAQGLTAVVAASLCRSQRVLSALLAAFVAGIMGAAAILLSVPAGTCIHAFSVSPNPSPCAAWPTFFEVRFVGRQTLAEGAVVALVAAGAVALVLTIRSRARRPAATITR
jgi:hypothetical protein